MKALQKITIHTMMLATIVAFASLTSCKDQEEQVSIVAKWKGTSAKATFEVFKVQVREEIDPTFDSELEFKEDKTVIVLDDGITTTGTYTRSGNTLTLTVDLNIEYLNQTETLTIKKATDTQLELYLEREGTFEDPDTGIDFTGTIKATLYFDKMP